MPGGNEIPPNLWERWETPGAHFFSYCPLSWGGSEESEHPCTADGTLPVQYFSGRARVAIRHTPLAVFLFLVWEISPLILRNGAITLGVPLFFIGSLMILDLILEKGSSWQELVSLVGGVLIFSYVVAGTGAYVYQILSLGPDLNTILPIGTALPMETLGAMGYYLLLYLGGILVYDGMLRTENLFCKLGSETQIINSVDDYVSERNRLAEQLRISRGFRFDTPWIPSQLGVGLVLLGLIIAAIWWGTTDLASIETIFSYQGLLEIGDFLIVLTTRLFIIVVAFKFIVLVTFLKRLSGMDSDHEVRFIYHPFHPDEMGGFRDIGKFATRVNVIIILGGAYLLYFSLGTGFIPMAIVWSVYLLVAALWLRHSIIPLHWRMKQDKEAWYREGEEPDNVDVVVGGFSNEASWDDIQRAPEWPLPSGQLTRLVSANLAPFVLWLLKTWLDTGVG